MFNFIFVVVMLLALFAGIKSGSTALIKIAVGFFLLMLLCKWAGPLILFL